MKKINYLLQILLKSALIFILIFIWLKFFLKSIWLSILIALSSTIFIEAILLFLLRKRRKISSLRANEIEDAENMFLSLIELDNPLNFFLNLVKTRHSCCIKHKNFIEIRHCNKIKTILYPFPHLKKLEESDIITIIKNTKKISPDKIVIPCDCYNKSCMDFLKNFNMNIVLLDKYQTYKLLFKEYEFYPEITIKFKKEKKKNLKDFISYSLNRSRSKGYIFSAIILFVMSFFVYQNIYYYVMISVLLLLGILSFSNKRYNVKIEKELL